MTKSTLLSLLCVLVAGVCGAAETSIPICCNKDAFTPLEPASLAGASLTVTRAMDPQAAGPKVSVDFAKSGEERRFLALQTAPLQPLAAYQALELTFSARADGVALMPAIMVYERDGGVWFRSGRAIENTAGRTIRLSLAGMRQAAFGTSTEADVAWAKVDRLWFGFLADGKGSGSFSFTKLVLTSEPYRPTEALSVFEPDAARWSVSADPAVKKELTTVKDEQGRPLLKNHFTFVGGRHMYLVPTQPVPEVEMGVYSGLRFTYKATVPEGIDSLLVCVNEGGGQFVANPAPPANGEWQTVVVPFANFKLASWSKPQDPKLDLDAISGITFGVHGVSKGGDGEILLRDIEVVP